MDPRNASARALPPGSESGDPEAIDFVRFCYRRRHVGWPELYDEMCAVAGRSLYRGFAADDLGRIGIGFALDQMPALATIVHQVVAEGLATEFPPLRSIDARPNNLPTQLTSFVGRETERQAGHGHRQGQ